MSAGENPKQERVTPQRCVESLPKDHPSFQEQSRGGCDGVSGGIPPGKHAVKLSTKRDEQRRRNLRRSVSVKEKKRREKVRKAKQSEQRELQEQEGGAAYLPGGF